MRAGLMLVGMAAAGLLACESRSGDTAQAAGEGVAADTIVTERSVQDTQVVTHDTTVRVDTTVRQGGEGGVGTDRRVVKDTRGQSDTSAMNTTTDTSAQNRTNTTQPNATVPR